MVAFGAGGADRAAAARLAARASSRSASLARRRASRRDGQARPRRARRRARAAARARQAPGPRGDRLRLPRPARLERAARGGAPGATAVVAVEVARPARGDAPGGRAARAGRPRERRARSRSTPPRRGCGRASRSSSASAARRLAGELARLRVPHVALDTDGDWLLELARGSRGNQKARARDELRLPAVAARAAAGAGGAAGAAAGPPARRDATRCASPRCRRLVQAARHGGPTGGGYIPVAALLRARSRRSRSRWPRPHVDHDGCPSRRPR